MSEKDLSPEQINEKEQSADSGIDDTSGDGFKFSDWPEKNRRFKMSRKWQAAGGIAGLGFAGIFGVLSILQGPAQLLHASQNLAGFHFAPSENASSSRIGRLYEFFRTGNDPSKRNIGYLGEKLTDNFRRQLSESGIDMNFETDPDPNSPDRKSRRLQSLSVNPDNTLAISKLKSLGFEPDGNGVVQFRNPDGSNDRGFTSTRDRRKALYAAVDALDKGRIASAITKRTLAVRAGIDFHPFRNVRRDTGERLVDFYRRQRADRAEKTKNGVNPRAGTRLEGDTTETDTGEQVPDPETGEIADNVNDVADEVSGLDKQDRKSLLSKRFAAKVGGGATAIVGAICAVKAIGDGIGAYKQANINLPMMRMAMEIISMGSQIQSGQDLNLEEVGEVVDTFHDEDTGSFFGAAGMQAVQREDVNGPDTNVKPSYDPNDRPELFNIIDIPPVNAVCKIEGAIGSVISTVTFGASDAIGEQAISAVTGVFGTSEDELMDRLFGILSGELVDPYATGTDLGNYAAIGGRLAANESALASGGKVIKTAEFNLAQEEFMKQEQLRIADLPIQDRLFDLTSGTSLATVSLAKMPNITNFSSAVHSLKSIPSILGSSLFGALTPKALAASSYDFGVPAYGIPQSSLDSEDFEDPYAVAEYVEPRLAEFQNNRYEKCYSTRIDPVTFAISKTDTPDNDDLQSPECTDQSLDARMFSMYMFDLVTFKSAACYEGLDDQACTEIGFGGNAQSIGSTGGAATIVGDKAFPLAISSKAGVLNGGGAPGSWQGTHNAVHEGYLSNDIYAAAGTEVVAFADGVVTALHSGALGNGVSVFNEESGLVIYYTHMDKINVSEGQTVAAGDSLGELASVNDYPDINVDHLHIDASVGEVRGTCSRNGACPIEDNFRDIGQDLFTLYQAVPD